MKFRKLWRPIWGITPATLLLTVAFGAGNAVIVLPGEVTHYHSGAGSSGFFARVVHGWPWTYLVRDDDRKLKTSDDTHLPDWTLPIGWSTHGTVEFEPALLVADVALAAALTVLGGLAINLAQHTVAARRFTLRGAMISFSIGCALLGGAAGFLHHLAAETRVGDALSGRLAVDTSEVRPAWLRRLLGRLNLYSTGLGRYEVHRLEEYFNKRVELRGDEVRDLGKLLHLELLEISVAGNATSDDFVPLSRLPHLQSVEIRSPIDAPTLALLCRLPLRELNIEVDRLGDGDFDCLSTAEALRKLTLVGRLPSARASGATGVVEYAVASLPRMPRLNKLHLKDIPLDAGSLNDLLDNMRVASFTLNDSRENRLLAAELLERFPHRYCSPDPKDLKHPPYAWGTFSIR